MNDKMGTEHEGLSLGVGEKQMLDGRKVKASLDYN